MKVGVFLNFYIMLLNKKNEFGATRSDRISKHDLEILRVDNLLGSLHRSMYRLLLGENLEHLEYRYFVDVEEFRTDGAIESLSPTTLLKYRFINKGCRPKSVVKIALEKIPRIEDVVRKNDAEIVRCSFKIGNFWLVKTCNILICDSSEVDPETGRMVVWPDDQKFELGWEIDDLNADQEEPQSC